MITTFDVCRDRARRHPQGDLRRDPGQDH